MAKSKNKLALAHAVEPQILVLSLSLTCMILGKSLHLSEPQFVCDNNF